jgi:hypothetical protein
VLLKQQGKKNREQEGAKETKSRKTRNETNITPRRHDAKKGQNRKTERKNKRIAQRNLEVRPPGMLCKPKSVLFVASALL